MRRKHDATNEYLLVGDESVVTKAGQTTHGLNRFFASLYGKVVPGIAFFALALVSTSERQSYPVSLEQRVRSVAEKRAAKAKTKRLVGRPKGSRNKPAN